MLFGNLNAFGPEMHFSYPPKPAGKAAWNIDWTAKVRLRSHSALMIGADFGGMGGGTAAGTPPEKKKQKCTGPLGIRSEAHTSELQKLMRISYEGFCWNKQNNHNNT